MPETSMICFFKSRSQNLCCLSGFVFALMACVSAPASADVLAFWNPSGTVNSSAPLPPASVSPSLASAGNLSGGPGLTNPGPFANAYEFDNWSGSAFDATDYLAFSTTGNNVTYSSVVFSLYNNYDGDGNWEIRSSVDGYASPLDMGTFSGIFFGGLLITADVSALRVQSGTVQFRIYTFNNSGATNPLQRGIRGTGGSGQGLTVNGSVSAGPPTNTTTTLNALPNPALVGQLITFAATVSVGQAPEAVGAATTQSASQLPSASPTGTVRFSEGATTLANNVALSGSVATFAYAGLSAGTHAITATYSGDATYSGSTTSINVTVNAAPPTTSATQAPALGTWGMLLLGVCVMAAVWRSHRRAGAKSRA
jgi:hypothetical protein